MAFFNFKNKEKEVKEKQASGGLVTQKKQSEKHEVKKTGRHGRGETGILSRAHVTEKTAHNADANTYVFAVKRDANKFAIRRAVEGKYGVTVRAVRTMHTKEKERRRGRVIGWKPGFKKAIVTIEKDQKIEIQ